MNSQENPRDGREFYEARKFTTPLGLSSQKKTQDGDKVQRKKTENGEKPVEKQGKTRPKKKLPSLIIEIGHRWPREVDQKRAY